MEGKRFLLLLIHAWSLVWLSLMKDVQVLSHICLSIMKDVSELQFDTKMLFL